MTIANVNIKKVLFRRGNTIQNDNYVGVFGEVSVDTQANTLRVHDGATAGGTRLATYAELTNVVAGNLDLTGYATTAQITAANVEIGKLRANITAANANIVSNYNTLLSNAGVAHSEIDGLRANITAANIAWTANAATQAISINTFNSNLGAFQTYANATFTGGGGGSTYSNTNVTAYLGHVTGNIIPDANVTYTLGDSTHWWKELYVGGNTIYIAGVPMSIDSSQNLLINGNIVQGNVTAVNSNITAANSSIATTQANIGAYQIWANANAGAQSTGINTVNANIGAYQIWANANAAAQTTSIDVINANIGAYQIWANANAAAQTTSIDVINANIGAYQIWANANAAAQTTAINLINANVTAANTAIASVTTAWTANAETQATDINALRANITAANTAIATQATDINALRANITASNTAIATLQTQVYSNVNTAAYLTGAVTTGNITAANVTVETNAVVLGNLRVVGTQTTVNATTLSITDLWVTVANSATQASDANGAGLRVAGALANIAYSSVSDSFEFNKPITIGNVKFSDATRFSGNTVTLPNSQGFNWNFNEPMVGSDTVKLYMNELTTGWATWALTTGNGSNSWYFDSDAQEFSLFNGGAGGKLAFGTAANAGVRSSIDDIELKSTIGNVYIRANANPWTFGEDGNLTLPTNMIFTTSPAMSGTGIVFGDGTYQYTAWDGVPGNELVNGVHTASLDTTGNLNVPGDILPLVDNLHDLGSATQRFRHLYVGPGTVYVGNAAIKTTATGNLILPGLTRPIASTAYAEEVDEEDDQTETFNSVPTVIDNAHYSYLNGNPDNLSFTPAEYSVDQLDGEGYIDGITVTSPGVGYAGQVESLAEQDMWATEVATPLASFNAGDWVRIPFRVRSRAGESEYDFIQGGGSSDRLVNDDQSVVLDSDGNTTFSGTIVMGNGDAVIGQDGDDFVISWDNEALVLRAVQDDVQVQADRSFQIDTDYNGSYKRWVFDTNGYLVHTTGDTQVYSELGNLTLQGGAVGLGSGNVNIVAVETGVAVQTWAFGNDGVLTLPKFGTINFVDPVIGGFGTPNTTTRTPGNRIVLYPSFNGSGLVDYAIGIDGNVQWYSIPDSNATFEWYAGSNKVLSLSGSGHLTLPEGGDILDSNGQSVLGGGSGGGNIAGLTSTVSNQAASHGSTVYSLTLNSDNDDNPLIEVYKGTGDNNSAISIGQSNSGFRQANVIAIGNDDVGYDALPGGVYIGYQAGWNDTEDPQGLHAIAIGSKAAYTFATNNSITLNATGNDLTPDESGLFIKPIREEQYDDAILYYNTQSGEVTYATNTGGGASIGNTAPTSVNGRLWYNTDDGRTYVYALDTWIDASPSVVPGNMVGYEDNGNIILNDDASIVYSNGVSILSGVAGTYGNTQVTAHLAVFDGNITKPDSGFTFSSTITNIILGQPVIVITTDSVFGGPVQGTVTISGVVGTTEINGVWGYESSDNNEFILYPVSNFDTAVDGTSWTPYVSGGDAVADYQVLQLKGDSVKISTHWGTEWMFDPEVGLIFPDETIQTTAYTGGGAVDLSNYTSGNIYINGEGRGLIVDEGGLKRYGFMKYFGIEGALVHNSEVPLRIGRTAQTDVTTASAGSLTTEIFIAANGKVGINTVGPTEQLDVEGNVVVRGNIYTQGNIVHTLGAIEFVASSSGDGYGLSTMSLKPYTYGYEDAYIILDPTYPNHIHIRAGGAQDNSTARLFLGGEITNFNIDSGAEPAAFITSNNNVWTFNTDGQLAVPGTVYGTGTNVTLTADTKDWTFYSNGTTVFPDHGAVSITGNLTVGNLTVTGNSTIINTTSYTVTDNIVQFADGNPADTLDLGFIAHRTVDSTLQHTGLIRDASDGNWKLFSNVLVQPGNTVDFADAVYDNLKLGTIIGTLAGNIDAPSGYINFTSSPAVGTSGITFSDGTHQTSAFSNTQVASYLEAQNITSANIGTLFLGNASTNANLGAYQTWANATFSTGGGSSYGNTEVAAYLVNGTSGNIKTASNVIAPNYLFANGVNILSTVSGGGSSYANADAAAYLAANSAIYLGNPATRYPLQANVTQTFIGNTTTIGAGSNQLGGTYILNNAYFGANGALYARNTQTGAAQFNVTSGAFAWSGTTSAVTANSVQSFAIWAQLNSSTLTTYNSIGITSAGLITASAGLSITSTGITTSLSSFPLVNTTATTINFGGAATSIVTGAATANLVVGTSAGRGNVFAGNLIGIHYGNAVGTTAAYSGNVSVGNLAVANDITVANITTTGTYGNITGANVISANTLIASGNVYSNGNIAMVSNVARYTWVSNSAPTSGQGSVGDIWYQTF